MSKCFICQRTEGVVELPLGPFCVQCIKEIGKHANSSEVNRIHRESDWYAMWSHLCASRERTKNKQNDGSLDEQWKLYFQSAVTTLKKRTKAWRRRKAQNKQKRAIGNPTWSEFFSKAVYELKHRHTYVVTESEWMKKWRNTVKNIRNRTRERDALQQE